MRRLSVFKPGLPGADLCGMAWRPMLLLSATLALLAAGSARAEIYRCALPDGSVRFTDSAESCESAVPHAPSRRLERVEPAGSVVPRARPGAIESLLPTVAEAGFGWEIVAEAPVDPSRDPDLVRWGVRAQLARRYTRDLAGTIQVCSVELWSFASPQQAAAAEVHFHHPGWRITREDSLLLMLHGLLTSREAPPRRGVFPACGALGDRVQARARASAAAR